MTASITPFEFHAHPDAIAELRRRLRDTIWPDEVDAAPWRYGPPVAYMKSFVDHWLNRYDWSVHEAQLNAFPRYCQVVDRPR